MVAPPVVEVPPRLPVRDEVALVPLKDVLPDRPRLLPIGPVLDVEPNEPVELLEPGEPLDPLLPKEEPLLPKEEPLLPELEPLLPKVLLVREPPGAVVCANAEEDQANSAAPTSPAVSVILYKRIMANLAPMS